MCTRENGVALVLVLAFLVLISALVIAFFSSVTKELSGSKTYASGASTKQLADSTVQIVIGAIGQATSGSTSVAWASQPGMIRTYGDSVSGSASATPLAFYKLYSSDKMVLSASNGSISFNPVDDLKVVPADNITDWVNKPAIFTDLNSPVTSGSSAIFPIVDGNAIKQLMVSGTQVLTYSTSGTSPDVAGFWVDPSKVTYNAGTTLSSTNTPAPMPVKWIYVLRNGELTAPDGVDPTGNRATWSGATGTVPTASNPIVGRVAFWTDDESGKININTASEGTYVDTPRVATNPDMTLAKNQPAQHEFQRYPGHPATTSLSTVLGSWLPLPPGGSGTNAYAGLTSANFATYMKPYYDLAPRIGDGIGAGSQGGSVKTGSNAVTYDTDRLYSSVDELMFKPDRTANLSGTSSPLTAQQLGQAKFFLTAHSRAPDVTLFNTPRVCIWPISATDDNDHRTPLDKLIAFCTRVNQYPYYFQRSDNTNPTNDIVNIARNQELFKYLRNLSKQPIPGFANSQSETFAAKYSAANATGGTDMDQVFTEIFDYIRCTNLSDNSVTSSVPTFVPFTSTNNVVPIYDSATDTKGFGRFLTVSQAALVFIATADGTWNHQTGNPPTNTISDHTRYFLTGTSATPAIPPSPASGEISLSAALLLDLFDPALGYPTMSVSNNYSINVVTSGFSCAGVSMNLPSPTTQHVSTSSFLQSRTYGGSWGPACLFHLNTSSTYPVYSQSSFMLPKANTFSFDGGTATVTITYKDSGGTTNTIQTINFKFPPGTFPTPMVVNSDLVDPPTAPQTSQVPWSAASVSPSMLGPVTAEASGTIPGTKFPWIVPISGGSGTLAPAIDFTNFQSRFDFKTSIPQINNGVYAALSVITPYDTARSIQSSTGDIRLIAAKQTISGTDPVFSPHPWYTSTNQSMAHSLIYADGGPLYGATRGSLVNITPPNNKTSGYWSETPGNNGGWGQLNGTYTQWYTPPGNVPFPGFDSAPPSPAANNSTLPAPLTSGNVPGMPPRGCQNVWGSNNKTAGGLYSAVVNGVTAPQWCATSGSNGISSNRDKAWIITNEPEVRSTNGVVSGFTPTVPANSFTDFTAGSVPGDWDNGMANVKDGAYINKPDEGARAQSSYSAQQPPYYDYGASSIDATSTQFSPNRQIPSAGMFGSLPTGVIANRPWQTLLFRPDPAPVSSTIPGHLGAKDPKDYLLLDLFTMPVVEPYPISEPLSTAGRINMNYQIVPFTYINRDTGIRAVMKSERMLAISNTNAGGLTPYKSDWAYLTGSSQVAPNYMNQDLRFDINADETLKGFQSRFANNDIFRSASEICSLDLIPTDTGAAYSTDGSTMRTYWNNHALTGDNSRERPYTDIYPRLTTKSNTYTVHFRVQTLKKSGMTSPATWDEGRDQMLSEYRGSQVIERYVDPGDTNIPDYPVQYPAAAPPSIDTYYKFRVLETKKFAP